MTAMSKIEAAFCRSAPWQGFAQRVVLPWALGPAEPRGRVLEIGCGAGAMACALAGRSTELELTAIDVDPLMAASATRRVRRAGRTVSLVVGDATRLPFAAASFDVVVSWLMLHHTIQWEFVVADASRVLRPGGRFVGYDLLDTPPARFVHRADRSEHRLFELGEFRAALNKNFESVDVNEALGGLVCRFQASATTSR